MAAVSNPIIQYIIVRGDLAKKLNWPSGAVMAQACHASVAAIHIFYNDTNTQEYLKNLDNMHKAVLEVPDEESLRKLGTTLTENNIDFKMWMEQPENIPTCIALKPYLKSDIKKYVRSYPLMKSGL